MATKADELPHGTGRLFGVSIPLILVLAALLGVGLFAYGQQLSQGEGVTGLRDIGTMAGVTWGLYVVAYVYLMGLSFAGIALAILIPMFGLEKLRPIARPAQFLTIASLMVAALAVIADVGQPGRALINLFRYARPGSPFFGTFTLVISGYLFASLVYLYLDARRDAAVLAKRPGPLQGFYRLWAAGYRGTQAEIERHQRASFWLAIAILPLLVTATSTLGFVFGLQVGRPGWFSALQAPGFVILGGLSGIGMLIIVAAILRRNKGVNGPFGEAFFVTMGNILMVLAGIYLYFMVVEWLSSAYSAQEGDVRLAQALIAGEYAPLFWLTVAFLAIPFGLQVLQFLTKKYQLSLTVLSGVLVNLAALGKRYLIVVPSQTHGVPLQYPIGSYSPTWVEYAVVLGLFSLAALLYIAFIRLFPVMDSQHALEGGE